MESEQRLAKLVGSSGDRNTCRSSGWPLVWFEGLCRIGSESSCRVTSSFNTSCRISSESGEVQCPSSCESICYMVHSGPQNPEVNLGSNVLSCQHTLARHNKPFPFCSSVGSHAVRYSLRQPCKLQRGQGREQVLMLFSSCSRTKRYTAKFNRAKHVFSSLEDCRIVRNIQTSFAHVCSHAGTSEA